MRIPINLTHDEAGASAVEYGLLIAGIAALIVAVVFLFGGMVQHVFTTSCGTVAGTISASGSC
ncbi:MAG: Flp family type IVb pilin [Marmoricola sp.]